MKQKLGILGGGQLGKMLLAETQRLDIYTKVMDREPDAPACVGANRFCAGEIQDFRQVTAFAKDVSVLTIEIENVNLEALEQLEKQGLKVYPSAKALRIIQNKIRQKNFYLENEIPSAPFKTFKNKTELAASVPALPFVWKSAEGGYDGRGVQIVRSEEALNSLPDVPCISEDLIPFDKELAVIVTRGESGEIKSFPLVEMEFHPEANQVEYVLCPAKVDEDIRRKAVELANRVAEKLNSTGTFAVEMFLTKQGSLLVNETAPRVHNSGHLSIEACYTGQFEQHIRAVTGMPLGSTALRSPAVMVNLVGEEGYSGDVFYAGLDEAMAMDGVYPHLYGKKQTRPFRKMGHITVLGKTVEEARRKAEMIKKMVKVISQ